MIRTLLLLRTATDADRADQLVLDDDGQTAGREIVRQPPGLAEAQPWQALCLVKTRYALRRLSLRLLSDSLHSWCPSLSRSSTPFGSSSGHAPCCTWKLHSDTSSPSSIDRDALVFV
jgi:hypothetical protein